MARRDRVPLTTPIPRPALKGWRIDRYLHIDTELGTMSGSISFYDANGAWVTSRDFAQVPGGGDLVLTTAQVDQIATLVVNRLQLRDPTLAGTRIVDTVVDSGDTVINP